MLERLLDIEVSESGTIFEEIELICTMTGFRRRFLVHHVGEGFYTSVELSHIHPNKSFFFVEGRSSQAEVADEHDGQPNKKRVTNSERRAMR